MPNHGTIENEMEAGDYLGSEDILEGKPRFQG